MFHASHGELNLPLATNLRNNYAHIINPDLPQFVKCLNTRMANRDFNCPGQACK